MSFFSARRQNHRRAMSNGPRYTSLYGWSWKEKKQLSTTTYLALVHLEWHINFPFACTSCFHTARRYNILHTVCEWRRLVDANKYRICKKNNPTDLYGFVQPERCIAHVGVKQLLNWMYKRQRWPEKQVFRMNRVAAERILHIRVYHFGSRIRVARYPSVYSCE